MFSPVNESPDLSALQRLREVGSQIQAECAKVIVGQRDVLELLLIALFARGHCLLVGVPGLAKTLMIRSLAETMALDFNRVQFTPDLMPADITGTQILQVDPVNGRRDFVFNRGPLFTNVLLADEINRTPPKTQAALLEAMQEVQVTVVGTRHTLPKPFFVLATQNPIEQEGTYPLPEAQQDRFMFHIQIGYPSEEDEYRILETTTATTRQPIQTVVSGDELLELQQVVRRIPVAPFILRYATQLTRMTRVDTPGIPEFVKKYVTWGAGPRAGQFLVWGAQARAALAGRMHVAIEDIHAVAVPVLRHRVITNYRAESEGIKPDQLVRMLIEQMPEARMDRE
nr:MoxR family ATPase [Tuwongella immobilis]